ncbi:hypothetical protein [Photorhabdus hainanensis]|uniref:hypothetical protein n=1 Tax=Photorhabdus hainanensis TaxID=1004166 RepID=UPI001BD6C91C|nr:hypothetical protein [Photorhabdus hainanensis]
MDKRKTVAETLAKLHQYHHLVGIERQPKQLKTSDFDGKVIFSNDPETASVPPAFLTVQTIQEMKELGGVPDSEYGPGKMEPHHPLPEPFSAERLADVMGYHIDLCKAFRAYIYGNSALVKDYEEMLNAKRFPMTVALYSGEKITITADNPLIVEDKDNYGEPVVLVYDEIIIEPGGQIIYCTNGRIEANTLVGNGSSVQQGIINKGSHGANGVDGAMGSRGATGSDGGDGISDKYGCLIDATPGMDGAPGSAGAPGGDGAPGGGANDLTIDVQYATGIIRAVTLGGRGGNGGTGGLGGAGGQGGNGGSSGPLKNGEIRKCLSADSGNGANGGDGGNGGNGGKGGDSGNIYVNYSDGDPILEVESYCGFGGEGGRGGLGGIGGYPGDNPMPHFPKKSEKYGFSGKTGRVGEFGDDGATGKIYINGKEKNPNH